MPKKTAAKQKKRTPLPVNTGGRPTKYQAAYAEKAYKLCLLGATDAEIAGIFGVTESTLYLWKQKHAKFSEAIQKGRKVADAEIAHSLYHRAKGYSHPDVHVSQYQGDVIVTPITKHYPPDTAAAFIWLKNRHPELWRDKQDVTHNINVTLEASERKQRLLELLETSRNQAIEADYEVLEESNIDCPEPIDRRDTDSEDD